jgi:hypothetical protein
MYIHTYMDGIKTYGPASAWSKVDQQEEIKGKG